MITFDELLNKVNTKELLTENIKFYQYKALVKITYNTDPSLNLGAERIAELLRALPGATRVSTASLDKGKGIGIFNVKLISQKAPKDAFIALKTNALRRFNHSILRLEVGAGSIETKNFFD